jgi:hypothetical protein
MTLNPTGSFLAALLIGCTVAVGAGHLLFPDLERAMGGPAAGSVFALIGAVFGGIVHELVASLLLRD